MKKILLSLMMVLVGLGVNAYTFTGEKITFSNDATSDKANDVQRVTLLEAGGLADFIQNHNDVNGYQAFGTTNYRNKVVFSGPMNEDDINAIKVNADDVHWGNFVVFDFTNVTTEVKPILPFSNKLIIWPSVVDVTANDVKSLTGIMWSNGAFYAYYTDKNPKVINTVAANIDKDFSNNMDRLKAMKGILNFEGLNFTYTEYSYNVDYIDLTNKNLLSTFFDKIKEMPVKSLGLWGFNISGLGTNFNNLNDETKYVILPSNDNNYRETTDFYKYTYNSNVAVVASYIDKESPFGQGANLAGYFYQVNNENNVKSMTLTYLLKKGELAGGADFLPSHMQNAERTVLCGNYNKEDLAAINHMTSKDVDMSNAVLVDGAVITDYSNSSTQHLALPNNSTKDDVDAVYQKLSSGVLEGVVAFTTQEVAATESYRTIPTNTLITYTKKQGLVKNLLSMIEQAGSQGNAANVQNLIMSGKLNAFDICNSTQPAGDLGGNKYAMVMASDGHLYAKDKNPEGTTIVTSGALNNVGTLNMVDFTSAIFDQPAAEKFTITETCPGYFTDDEKLELISDMNFTALSLTPKELYLPTDESQILLPPYFLPGGSVKEICIPYNYQYIMEGAFNYCGPALAHIYTTADPNAENFIDSEADHGVEYDEDGTTINKSTYTIGSNVKYIGYLAFDTNTTCPVADVYVLAKEAPVCEPYAFNSVKLVGNNGFSSSHPISRENYKNGGSWIAVLHFPNALNDDAKKKYTDIDREYWYKDETGAVDGEGNLLSWPAHSEFMRSYNQARLGYTWKEWDTSRETREGYKTYGQILVVGSQELTGADNKIQTVKESSYDDRITFMEITGELEEVNNKSNDCANCGFTNTIGWHQFLLASPGHFYEATSTNYKETPWYTFSIPYDMTLAELNQYLGVPQEASANAGAQPDVRTLIAVKRNQSKNHIDLVISKNLVANAKDVKTYGQLEGDNIYKDAEYVDITRKKNGEDVYLKGGYPYFVKGWIPDTEENPANLGQYVLAKANFKTKDLGNVIIVNSEAISVDDANVLNAKMYEEGDENFIAMPYFNHTVDAKAVEGANEYFYGKGERTLPTGLDKDLPYLYNFMGNYESQSYETMGDKHLPLFTYYMAGGKIYRNVSHKDYLWKPYICLVGHAGVGVVQQRVISEMVTYHSEYKNVIIDSQWGANEYAGEELSAAAPSFSLVFDDDIIDGEVNQITYLDGKVVMPVEAKFYNLNGQYVGDSLNNLPKGVYVANGRKFVIK